MYGEIKTFHALIGVGVIAAEDGRNYRFQRNAILNGGQDLEGQEVHFELSARQPEDIIVLAGSPWSAFGPAHQS